MVTFFGKEPSRGVEEDEDLDKKNIEDDQICRELE